MEKTLYRSNPRFFVFRNVLAEHLEELSEAPNKPVMQEIIITIFKNYIDKLRNDTDPETAQSRTNIFMDLIIGSYKFARKNNYTNEKISCLLDLTYETIKTTIDKRLDEEKAFSAFKEFLLRHSMFRPPHSINTFTLQEIKDIVELFQNSFFRNYGFYVKAFQPAIDFEIVPFRMFAQRFPRLLDLNDGQEVNKDDFPVLDAYNKDKEIKLTPEELKEIMEGRSVHDIPEHKRREIIKRQLEQQKKAKVERYMKKELELLQAKMDEKIKKQDEEFNTRVQALTKKK